MQHYRPHPPVAAVPGVDSDVKRGKKRGSYNCGRCGLPKKGHNCNIRTPTSASASTPSDSSLSTFSAVSAPSSVCAVRQPPPRQPFSRLPRALSFDDVDDRSSGFDPPEMSNGEDRDLFSDPEQDLDSSGLPVNLMWEVLKRLPPTGLLSAAKVCKRWRDTTRRLWRAAEELRLRVPKGIQLGFVASMLQKCPGIARLSLKMESDLDSTMLACIAFSCPNLEFMEISTSDTAINRINGDELSRFVADKRSLKTLKMEGCHNLGGFVLCSSSLSTLWLSSLHSISKMIFNCPQLREISLEFSRQDNEGSDITTVIENLGRTCPRLQNIHIASMRLSHTAVLALTAAQLRGDNGDWNPLTEVSGKTVKGPLKPSPILFQFRNWMGLRMLSLVLGSEVTDASVAAIASSYPNLELLDLSGSSISDGGIGIICNVFPETLTRLLLALCHNVTSSGIQFATAQLPLLELMDCGMTICDTNSENPTADENLCKLQGTSNANIHHVNQKLIIKHNRLKKLSLWGCSGLDALYLNCPQLNDLNLNSCKNLHPERLLLQCPSLENVHASGCQDMLIGAIQSQVYNASTAMENPSPFKRLPDGSKRVRVPHFLSGESVDDGKKRRRIEKRLCNVLVD